MERKYVWFQEQSHKDILDYTKNVCDIAVLPLGAIEQHGPHCPTGDDTFNANGMCELIAKKTGVTLLPNPMYGTHPPHHWDMPGTIPLKTDTQKALIKDIVRGASIAGFNKFILFSAHGQVPTVTSAMQDLGVEGYFVLTMHWYEWVRDVHHEIMESTFWHAGETETSVALYLFPQYVDMSKAAKGGGTPFIDPKFISPPGGGELGKGSFQYFEGTFSRRESAELDSGIIGDATLATREKGEKIVTVLVDRVSEVIEDIKQRWPVGVKPPVK